MVEDKKETGQTGPSSLVVFGAAASLVLSFIAYGVFQERIMTIPFGANEETGDKGEFFKFTAFLVLSNRIFAFLAAMGMLYMQGLPLSSPAPLHKYLAIAVSNTISTYCQYEALRYISFPTQTLGKCAKTLPVLILGSLIGGKKYSITDYIECVIITVGCTVFFMGGDVGSKNGAVDQKSDELIGLILMATYLFLDGFTSVFQESLFRGYKMSQYTQMMYVNGVSGIISIIILIGDQQLVPSTSFALQNPDLLIYSTFLSVVAMTGQIAIYYSIKNIGALFFATVMTTRQVISILLSSILFNHYLTLIQWLSTAAVFGTLYWKSFVKKSGGHGHGSAPPKDLETGNVQKI